MFVIQFPNKKYFKKPYLWLTKKINMIESSCVYKTPEDATKIINEYIDVKIPKDIAYYSSERDKYQRLWEQDNATIYYKESVNVYQEYINDSVKNLELFKNAKTVEIDNCQTVRFKPQTKIHDIKFEIPKYDSIYCHICGLRKHNNIKMLKIVISKYSYIHICPFCLCNYAGPAAEFVKEIENKIPGTQEQYEKNIFIKKITGKELTKKDQF